MQYLLLIYNCDRPEPSDPGFADALDRVNAFADECHRRSAAADPAGSRAPPPRRPPEADTRLCVRGY